LRASLRKNHNNFLDKVSGMGLDKPSAGIEPHIENVKSINKTPKLSLRASYEKVNQP